MTTPPAVDVLVVGSLNHDVVARTQRRPAPGETVTGGRLSTTSGGKGGNQAAAAARAGAVTAMLGAVGGDDGGRAQLDDLVARGVDVSRVAVVAGVPTSTAVIVVDAAGENAIVVCAGANETVTPQIVHAAPAAAAVVLAQTELGAAVVDAAAELAAREGARLVVSCGPVVELSPPTLAAADPVVVNRHEAADLLRLAGAPVATDPTAFAASLLAATGARSVCVTLGADGHVTADGAGPLRVAGAAVEAVVDTTGAGDAFVGALAAALARGASVVDAARAGAAAGAGAVAHAGARPPR
ncbi:PfkB family carbohydrate kinase [Blastococcus haudaquaticus]|uniref:Ribokinase n=1 Tax=Blastococcus haudaquaticus TaxID=1938745 RepID=A0A286H2C7_9ACTN|nr:PfkB family carbohydrate kinase [Blastococcus haudaquaticus]SOE01489.1 ribokinase [Blastococcus haudaquaticus]